MLLMRRFLVIFICLYQLAQLNSLKLPFTHQKVLNSAAALLTASSVLLGPSQCLARPEGVNRPDLLPITKNEPVIDVANFLR